MAKLGDFSASFAVTLLSNHPTIFRVNITVNRRKGEPCPETGVASCLLTP
jgi:hypothetical protein